MCCGAAGGWLGWPASSAGNIAFYVSPTPVLTPASVFLVYANLFDTVPASGGTPNQVLNVALSSNLAAGTYYMIVVANFDHKINESNYSDNASNALPITVVAK